MAIPPSQAKTGYGSKFALAATSVLVTAGGSGVDWAEVKGLKPPSDSWDTAEVTHFQSPDLRREWIKTLMDSGEADIAVNLVPGGATDLAMQAANNSPDAQFYIMLIPKPTSGFWKISGQCLVTGYDRDVAIGDAMASVAKMKFTGTRTEAVAA